MTTLISAKLTLAVRLIDTTTGRDITEPNVRFTIDGNDFIPMKKGDGLYAFVNVGRDDFLMQIDVYGYDTKVIPVIKEELDQKLPMLDVFLMPSEKNRAYGEVLEVYGTLSDLSYIEAINLNRPIALFHSSQTKKEVHKISLLSMTPGGGVSLDSLEFALLSETGSFYDTFKVLEQDSTTTVRISKALRNEHKLNDRIFRILYGDVKPEGNFVLKVRDDASSLPHLLHFVAGEKEYFREIDIHLETGEIDLLEGAVEYKPIEQEEEQDKAEGGTEN